MKFFKKWFIIVYFDYINSLLIKEWNKNLFILYGIKNVSVQKPINFYDENKSDTFDPTSLITNVCSIVLSQYFVGFKYTYIIRNIKMPSSTISRINMVKWAHFFHLIQGGRFYCPRLIVKSSIGSRSAYQWKKKRVCLKNLQMEVWSVPIFFSVEWTTLYLLFISFKAKFIFIYYSISLATTLYFPRDIQRQR